MTLWMKFPDEAVAGRSFGPDDRARLDAVFTGAPWQAALKDIGLAPPAQPMLTWRHGAPYINWTAMTALLSGGTMVPVRGAGGDYALAMHYTLRGIWRMMRAQWSLSRYMRRPLAAEGTLAESIALGLVLQSLLMRLGAHAQSMAAFMASPGSAPAPIRKILRDIQAVQMRRTHISPVWDAVLPQDHNAHNDAPAFFWDGDSPALVSAPVADTQGPWKGQPVCAAGQVTGIAVAVTRTTGLESIAALKARYNAPAILVFETATPDAVLLYAQADALAFETGGALSHACTVAREQNIPAVTAIGPGLHKAAQDAILWLTVDGATGIVTKV